MNQAFPTASVRLLPLGDCAWTVEFGASIDAETHGRVIGFCSRLERLARGGHLGGVLEWVPTFRSVTVHFDPLQTDAAGLGALLLAEAAQAKSGVAYGRRWRLPACFDAQFGPDLEEVAKAKALEPGEVVRLLTEVQFEVFMLGFLPGFPYLGGLPESLEMPRLASPRTRVPARSVAIAGRSCAVYPCESPGGWRLLGRTPVPMFDLRNTGQPALLAPGDRLSWQAVDRTTYESIERDCAAGCFDLTSLLDRGQNDERQP